MDLKYIIWNYQAKRIHFTCNRKIWSYQLMNTMLQTFKAPDIINVFLYTSLVNCQYNVKVYSCTYLAPNYLKDFPQKSQVNGHPPV